MCLKILRRRHPPGTFQDRPVADKGHLLPVLQRSYSLNIQKLPVKAGNGVEAHLLRDGKNRQFRGAQKDGGFGNPGTV